VPFNLEWPHRIVCKGVFLGGQSRSISRGPGPGSLNFGDPLFTPKRFGLEGPNLVPDNIRRVEKSVSAWSAMLLIPWGDVTRHPGNFLGPPILLYEISLFYNVIHLFRKCECKIPYLLLFAVWWQQNNIADVTLVNFCRFCGFVGGGHSCFIKTNRQQCSQHNHRHSI